LSNLYIPVHEPQFRKQVTSLQENIPLREAIAYFEKHGITRFSRQSFQLCLFFCHNTIHGMKRNIVLAYSGGLDTSFCIPYLAEKYDAEIHAVTVDCGSIDTANAGDLEAKAKKLGAASFTMADGKPMLVDKVIKYLIFGNVLRDRTYPLCVGSERFVQAVEVIKKAREIGADAIAHGSTGAGNDQVRFDVALRALFPEGEIITPIRDEAISRQFATDFLKARGFDVPVKTTQYSINKGIWGTSIGGKETAGSKQALPFEAFPEMPVPAGVPDAPETISIGFEKGIPVSLNGEKLTFLEIIERVRALGTRLGIGRGMHLGDTILGFKGRIGFEAPAATILYAAHRELEKLVLSKWQRHTKDQLADQYGMLLHEGQFFEPVMRNIESFLESSQETVTGEVSLYGYKGSLFPLSSASPNSLMERSPAKYGEEAGGWTGLEARAFCKLYAIPSLVTLSQKS
jgi:argininosuccinate synthase